MSHGDQPAKATVDRHFMQVLLRAGIVVAVLAGIGVWIYLERTKPVLRTELSRGEQALVVKDMKTAEEVAQIARRRAPNAPETLVYLAQVDMLKEKYDDALTYLKKVPAGTPDTVSARGVQARITMVHLRDFQQAESLFREALLQDPNNEYALENFASLLLATARVPEYRLTELHLLKLGHPTVQRLAMLNMADLLSTDNQLMKKVLEKHPDDVTAHTGLGDWLLRRNDIDQALTHLQKAVKARPDLIDAQANIGLAYLWKQDDPAFVEWHRLLPEKANENPKIWLVRGDWAVAHGQTEAAMRCYWEALKIEGAQVKPAFLLGSMLFAGKNAIKGKDAKDIDKTGSGLKFLALAFQLHNYSIAMREQASKLTKDSESKDIVSFAALAKKIGLYLEALAWLEIDHYAGHEDKAAEEMYKEVKTAIGTAPLLRLHPSQNPALIVDLSSLPLPDMTATFPQPKESTPPSPIAFDDQAEASGLNFKYFNGGDPTKKGPGRMSEMFGGGVAILDYDQDGYPDIYLTQGTPWPVPAQQTTHLDRLFRNLGNGKFEDVTASAGLAEDRFSQGVGAGDYNNDGFPDIYVANIGRNRLYLNNGDGTFSDVSSSSGTLAGDFWSTSCAIADVNGDTLPDLYSVNFLANDALKANCRDAGGGACYPGNFAPAPDQVYHNLGRGNFRDVSKTIGVSASDGRGTSLMIGDLDGTGRTGVLLGQDSNRNACFINISKPGQPPRFDEYAWVLGLALANSGFSPSPFGITAGDVNNDGLIDLLTTNRVGLGSTLYLNRSGRFEDASLQAQLRNPTLKLNGFGAQFLDLDLDGNLDLIQANGDTNVSADPEVSYELPPLAFRNQGDGRFQQLKNEQLGKYFQSKYSGRSVVRVDWNQDGLDDVVMTNLNTPVALLTNSTKEHGNFLTIQLRGVTSTRDAIGTTVKVKVGDRTLTRQLTAGDGFQASNERVLNFGLGKAPQVDEILIKWPTGQEQKISKTDANRSILVIEGKEVPLLLWKKG